MYETRPSLIIRVQDPSDSESWGEFVALYQPLLVKYARRKGLGEHDAQDVAQEILISLLRALPDFRLDHEKGRFRGWLWRIVYNSVMSWQRQRQRREHAEDQVRDDEIKRQLIDESEPPEEWLSEQRRRVLEFSLQRVRERTKPEKWACFEQHVLAQRPAADVARELQVTANLVFVNSSRVLKEVREQCAEYLEELADD